MRLDILLDHIIGHVARADGKVAPCPQVSSPVLATQFAELFQQSPTTPPFQPLHQFVDRQIWRHRNQQMDMIHRHMSTDDIYIQVRACLPDQLPQTDRNLTVQHRFTILRNPHHMVFQVVNRVRCLSITHCPFGILSFQHGHHHTVRASALPLVHRSVQPAQSGVKTACL